MTDPTPEAAPPRLTPANQNPWYVLATLYGEQEGEEIDPDLHERNRRAWNAWSCQTLGEDARKLVANSSSVAMEELAAWISIKTEVAQLHESEWRRRNGDTVPYPGLPDVTDIVDFKRVAFSNWLLLRGCIFTVEVQFNDALFRGDVWFNGTTFSGNAWFIGAVFTKPAEFSRAIFSNNAGFSGAVFFDQTTFIYTHFTNFALFVRTKFYSEARFDYSTFGRQATFVVAIFGKRGGTQSVSFADCQFDKPLNFRGAKFFAHYPIFSGAMHADRSVFTAKFDHWPETTTQDLEEARESCAAIRHMLDKQGLPEEAHFFFRREMEFASKIGTYWLRLPYRLYGKLSDYGHSIALPVEWLTALVVTGWAIIAAWLAFSEPSQTGARWYQPLVEGLGLSISGTLPFLGLMRTMHPDFYERAPWWLDAFSALQSLAGIVLLFLLGLGLRTRFRMR
jgi:hypothetical protein